MREEDLNEKLRRVNEQRKKIEEDGTAQRFQELSRRRLAKILRKKVTTAFIGALAKFEQFFGPDIWGHGKTREECTAEQLAWRNIWEQCRTDILNNGNNQLRAIENEIVEYSVAWLRYQAVILPKDD